MVGLELGDTITQITILIIFITIIIKGLEEVFKDE